MQIPHKLPSSTTSTSVRFIFNQHQYAASSSMHDGVVIYYYDGGSRFGFIAKIVQYSVCGRRSVVVMLTIRDKFVEGLDKGHGNKKTDWKFLEIEVSTVDVGFLVYVLLSLRLFWSIFASWVMLLQTLYTVLFLFVFLLYLIHYNFIFWSNTTCYVSIWRSLDNAHSYIHWFLHWFKTFWYYFDVTWICMYVYLTRWVQIFETCQ